MPLTALHSAKDEQEVKGMEPSELQDRRESRPGISPASLAVGGITLLVVALLAYALLAGPDRPPDIGDPVPDFQLVALDGSLMSLSSYRGQVVVLNFFASWCAPCRQEAADLEQAWRKYRGTGVQFLGIGYKDAPSKAQDFVDTFNITYPIAVETDNLTARAYGVTGVPETFIIDQEGNLVRHFLGAITLEQISQEVDPLLNR